MSLFDKLQGNRKAKIEEEKQAGAKFLAENKQDNDVIELPSGIQYKVITAGSGPKPDINNTIKAHYSGKLLNGSEFDSSYKRNQPFSAPITKLIKGWQEVLPMMPTGSKWRLWIPSDLAYGDAGVGQAGIPGGAMLDFEIELLEIIS
ncbi:MAG TPA: FKBP-type peptidyl-prolyl cis-trans isomerase [Chitinophagaceae bacterium]|nr:FKBP-type peptidyl-prolyl cis-trans isomerase [Chitinophagaceae bacterium]